MRPKAWECSPVLPGPAFWAKLPGRLARLANRVGVDEHGKIYGALHDRIPMVTPEEQGAVQEENFKDDERFWDTMRDLNAASVEEHKSLIASAEAKLKGHESAAADAGEKLETGQKSPSAPSARGERQRRLGQKARHCRRNEGGRHKAGPSTTHASLRQPDEDGVRVAVGADTDEASARGGGQGLRSRGAPDHTGAAVVAWRAV